MGSCPRRAGFVWQRLPLGNVVYARRELADDASLPAVGAQRLEDYFRARLLDEALESGPASPSGQLPTSQATVGRL